MDVIFSESFKNLYSQVGYLVVKNYSDEISKITAWTPVSASDAVFVCADTSTCGFVNLTYYRRDVSAGIDVIKRSTELM